MGAALAGRAEVDFARMLLGVVDEFLHRLDRQLGGIDDDHLRRLRHQRHRHEVLLDVVVQALVQRRRQRMVRPAHEEGVAVGPGLGGHAGAHGAARAPPPPLVVDHHRLPQLGGQLLGQRTGEGVGAAPGRERHDERDGPFRPGRGAGAAGETGGQRGQQGRGESAVFHIVSSCCSVGRRVSRVSSLVFLGWDAAWFGNRSGRDRAPWEKNGRPRWAGPG